MGDGDVDTVIKSSIYNIGQGIITLAFFFLNNCYQEYDIGNA
jgi:hypothetical protein